MDRLMDQLPEEHKLLSKVSRESKALTGHQEPTLSLEYKLLVQVSKLNVP